MAKVRCSYCRSYVEKETLYRCSPLLKVCSAECMTGLACRRQVVKKTKHVPASKKETDGGIPKLVREEVLARDRYRCRYCAGTSFLHLHHIIYRSQGGIHEPWNLITLCEEHHSLMHSDKRRWMPVLQGVNYLYYFSRTLLTVPQTERWLNSVQVRGNVS